MTGKIKMKNSGVDWIHSTQINWDVEPLFRFFDVSKTKIEDGILPALSVGYMGVVPQLDNAAKNLAGGERKHVRAGDLAINSRSDRMGAGGVAIQEGGVSLVYHVLRPRHEVNGRFFHYVIRNIMFSQEFYRRGNGIVADLWSTKDSELKRIPVPVPPPETQQKIVEFLDQKTKQIDQVIEKKKRMIELLKEKRTAIITQAVTKGLDPYAKMKNSSVEWIGEIPEGWEVKKLKSFFKLHFGGVWGDEERGDKNDVVCLRVADFNFDYLSLSEANLTIRNIPQTQTHKYLTNRDILLEKSGGGEKTPVGRAVHFDLQFEKKSVCSNFIEKMKLKDNENPRYVIYAMAALYLSGVTVKSIKQTTGIQNLDLSNYMKEQITYPPKAFQENIVKYLDIKINETNQLIQKIELQITKLTEYRTSLIYNAVTGKMPV